MFKKIQKLLQRLNKKRFFRNTSAWLFFIFALFLPTQLGQHFWPDFSYLNGLRIDYLSPTLYLTDLILLALVLSKVKILIEAINNKLKPVHLVLPLSFILFSYLSTAEPLLLTYRLWQYNKIILTTLVFSQITKAESKRFLQGLLLSSCYVLFLAIGQIVNQGSLQGIWWFLGERQFTINTPDISTISLNGQRLLRAYGTFSHSNSLAGFYLVLFWLFLTSQIWLGALISAILIGLSFSKITIIILCLSLAIWSLLKSNRCFICQTAKIMLLSWLIFFSFMLKGDASSLQQRVLTLQKATNYLLTNPQGAGLGQYLLPLLPDFYQPIHNLFLLFWLETGLVGLVFSIYLIKPALKLLKNKLGFLLLLITTTGLFDHYWLTLQQNMLLLGMIVGLIIAVEPKAGTLD